MSKASTEAAPSRLSVSAVSAGLVPGRAYRLEIPGHRLGRDFAQIHIQWERAGTHGDEYFPYPRVRGGWLAPVLSAGSGGYIEFRAPGSGVIHFCAEAGSQVTATNLLERAVFAAVGPSFPPALLRSISDIAAAAQDRCSLVDVSAGQAALVPLPSRVNETSPEKERSPGKPGGSVAFLGSVELLEELSFDCDATMLEESTWQDALQRNVFDYLLVEPVLHVEQQHWRYAMARSGERSRMLAVIQRCREIDLPVVVWLRVEPELYGEFSWIVPLARRVYAIDSVIHKMVLAEYPGVDVQVLPPCVQPRLHNPFADDSRNGANADLADKVLLDGWWRMATLDRDRLIAGLQRDRLLVTESEWEFSFTRLGTLPTFRWNTIGCTDRKEKAFLSRFFGAELFLPDETVPNWRREQMMLRSAACGSVVLFRDEGLPSLLIEEGLCRHGGDDLLLSALPSLVDSALERARWRHRVVRAILERHTYRIRLARIARDLGLARADLPPPRVACLLVSMRPWLLEGCIERFRRDQYPEKELIIVVHGSPSGARRTVEAAAGDARIRVLQMGRNRSLGMCLNHAAQHTAAPFWAKFDDDDLYGPQYLSDMMLHQQIADSSLMAKPPAFIYLENADELLWHGERARRAWTLCTAQTREATAGIAGGTLMGKRSLLRDIPFSEIRRGGSDSDLVLRARRAGHDLLVTDPFNFAFFRSKRQGFHTWDTDWGKLRRRSTSIGSGADINRSVFV